MLKDLSQEITNQSNDLIGLAPKIAELNKILEQQIVSDDLMEQYNNVPPAQKDAWVKANANKINASLGADLDNLMVELITQMDAIFGSNQRVQSLMAAQQQQNLQAAQKPAAPATAPVESLE
jgi:hypothetical protein